MKQGLTPALQKARNAKTFFLNVLPPLLVEWPSVTSYIIYKFVETDKRADFTYFITHFTIHKLVD